MNMKTILKRFDRINASSIDNEHVAKRVAKLQARRKQGGFTLLELLVVVAILAAIAGTATIALQDTDARASAAAHVAMMDELNKGIRTYRVLNGNSYPNGFDSLIEVDDVALANPELLEVLAIEDIVADDITSVQMGRLAEVGLSSFNYVANDQDPAGDGDCTDTNIGALIGSRQNAVVAGNIFMSANGNGCGVRADFVADINNDGDTTPNDDGFAITSQAAGADPVTAAAAIATLPIATWNGGAERLTGQAEAGAFNDAGNTVFMATGVGPASSLFAANSLGGMTSTPAYRHVSGTEYNRFIALWDIGEYDGAGAIIMGDQPALTTIVDGAGDTKDEELGEWDGTRNTI